MSHEIRYSLNNTKNSEKLLKHKINFFNEELPKPIEEYKVPDFGVEPDIVTSLNNMRRAESVLNHKFNVTKESVPENAP
jgi:hypothetical protein